MSDYFSDAKETTETTKVPTFSLDGRYQLSNGILHLNGVFTRENILPVIASIVEYNAMPPSIQPPQIVLFINSEGGRLDQMYNLIDTMNASVIPITTIATGMVASAGLMTFMAGHRRLVSSTCRLMSHAYSGGTVGTHHSLMTASKEYEQVFKNQVDLYQRLTGLSKKKIKKKLLGHQDVWLTPKQAIKYNIADEIVDFFKEREITMEELNATSNQEPDHIDYQEDDYPSQDRGYKTYSISDLIQSFDEDSLYDLQESIEREIDRRTDPSTDQS